MAKDYLAVYSQLRPALEEQAPALVVGYGAGTVINGDRSEHGRKRVA